MPPAVRLFAPDREEIVDLDSWLAHAPPETGWKDGSGEMEQAKAWLRSGEPSVPEEVWSALAGLAGDVDDVYARPEHPTRLDGYGGGRQHDLFACVRRRGTTALVVGVEAKAGEHFAGTVADRAAAPATSNDRARCNLLSRALFGREVVDAATGDVLDPALGAHGFELWTAAVGTVIEAQQRRVEEAVLLVQQFVPRDPGAAESTGDPRHAAAFDAFAADIRAAGSISHETEFVKPGTRLHVIKVESLIEV